MNQEHPKQIKRQIRELKAQAHENELALELAKLAGHFDAWRAGKISAGELTDLIHKYHNGPARELWSFYNSGQDDLVVAAAVAKDILRDADVPDDVRQHIQPLIDFCRHGPGA